MSHSHDHDGRALDWTPLDEGFRETTVRVNGVALHLVAAGPAHPRRLVLLLHGFPEFWWSWRAQLAALGRAGYFVVAPDLRGFNESECPDAVDAYRLDTLIADVTGTIRACGATSAVVVGHNWGGAIAWSLAQAHPALVDKLAILNSPHPERWRDAARSPRQLLRSSYVFFFQLPRLPEWLLSRRDYAALRRAFEMDGFSADETEPYVAAARRSHALHGGLNYYRAFFRLAVTRLRRTGRVIDCPTLVIWGERDRFLGPELATPPPHLVPRATVVRIPDGTHWVQHDAPDRVNDLLLRFLLS